MLKTFIIYENKRIILAMDKDEEIRILSIQEVLHLQSDKHEKKDTIMPNVDTSRYVLHQRPKTETVRNFNTTINISEEERRQFNQGNTAARSRNAIIAEQARLAVKIAEKHAEEEAIEHEKTLNEMSAGADNAADKLTDEIKDGSFDFSFGALIEGSENLKEKI